MATQKFIKKITKEGVVFIFKEWHCHDCGKHALCLRVKILYNGKERTGRICLNCLERMIKEIDKEIRIKKKMLIKAGRLKKGVK